MTPTNTYSHTQSRRRFLQQSTATLAALTLTPSHLFAATETPGHPTILATPSGKLRGEIKDSLRIFRGIPFAQPPIGPLRFRPPLPIKPWSGIRNATTFAPAAPQPDDPGVTHSEDCLYLNVWAPTGPGPFPVFVWIHGGGYTNGRSFDPLFDGARFARNGIVFVSVAYRLGALGFLDLEPLLGPTYADSANNATRDLTLALQWVHHNIAAFAGDPTRVTVGGESAGAKATAALMAIPAAASLFQSAISESGGGERINTLAQAAEVAHQYGQLWRTQHPSASPNFHDLLTASPADLLHAQTALIATSDRHFPFRAEVGSTFLPQRPVDLVAAGSFQHKRLLIGTNRDENALFLGPHPPADPTSSNLGNLDLDTFNHVFAKYKSLYPDMTDSQRRIRAVSAEEYWVPSVRLAEAQTQAHGPTWMYRLDYAKPSGPMAGQAYHSLDLSLVWQTPDPIEAADPTAAPLALQMHQAWVNFILGNDPTAPTLPPWPTYNLETRATMILADQPHIEDNPNQPELQLWNSTL